MGIVLLSYRDGILLVGFGGIKQKAEKAGS